MNFFNKLLGNKEEKPNSYQKFWEWFKQNEKEFYKIVEENDNIEAGFFDKLSSRLEEIKSGFYFLAGMPDDHTVELILTADGVIPNIVFVEELVAAAPNLPHWKFTALKPPHTIEDMGLEMGNYIYNSNNLSFYSNEHSKYPDEVDIVIVHDDFKKQDADIITNGVYIFLDNYLGELNAITTIDNLRVTSKEEAEKDLVPISKLKSYLIWREKEFVEKYSGLRYNAENDVYASLQAELANGLPLIAVVNSTLLEWDSKASHPWILKIEIKFDGSGNYGMPSRQTYDLLDEFENDIILELQDHDGYLNIGRETADSERIIYFACNDFRKPSKVMHQLNKEYADKINFNYAIYKDKYWQSLEKFRPKDTI